ncbi:MAG: hypothetical protein Q7J06_01485 [Bacteroidales bacterium]|nr:hypothetical protein [Bacteroidales bacterium]
MTKREEYTTARLYDCTRALQHDCTMIRGEDNAMGRKEEVTTSDCIVRVLISEYQVLL